MTPCQSSFQTFLSFGIVIHKQVQSKIFARLVIEYGSVHPVRQHSCSNRY